MEVEEVVTAAPPLPGCPTAAKIDQSSLACRGRQRRKRPHQRWAPASARTGSGRAPGRSAHPGGMDAGGQGSGRHSGNTQGEGHRGRIVAHAGVRRWQGGWERDGDAEMGGGEGAQLGGGADRGACARCAGLWDGWWGQSGQGWAGQGQVGPCGSHLWWAGGPAGPPPAGARHVRAMPDTSRPTAVMIRSSARLTGPPGTVEAPKSTVMVAVRGTRTSCEPQAPPT